MAEEALKYCMWIDWHQAIVSFHPVQGYELIQFSSRENFQVRIHILVQSGFRFQ